MIDCRYCGNAHDVRDLCRARRVSRRMFCFTASVAAVGACLPGPLDPLLAPAWRDGTAITAITLAHTHGRVERIGPYTVAEVIPLAHAIRAMGRDWDHLEHRDDGTWIAFTPFTGRPHA